MYRLFYVSTVSPGVGESELDKIVAHANESNIKQSVSGILAFNGFNFAQILEGEKDSVLSLYDKIREDPRHSGVILISEKAIEKRAYSDWGMSRSNTYHFDELVKAMAI